MERFVSREDVPGLVAERETVGRPIRPALRTKDAGSLRPTVAATATSDANRAARTGRRLPGAPDFGQLTARPGWAPRSCIPSSMTTPASPTRRSALTRKPTPPSGCCDGRRLGLRTLLHLRHRTPRSLGALAALLQSPQTPLSNRKRTIPQPHNQPPWALHLCRPQIRAKVQQRELA